MCGVREEEESSMVTSLGPKQLGSGLAVYCDGEACDMYTWGFGFGRVGVAIKSSGLDLVSLKSY